MRQVWSTRMLRIATLALVFLCAFVVRSLYAVQLSAVMYGTDQPGTRMAWRYHEAATAILAGEGVLWPREPDPARTGLMARPPGYATFVAVVYTLVERSFFATQLVQNLLTSFACVLLVVLTGRLLSWRVGVVAGLITAVSPHVGFVSNIVLPDALSALPLAAAVLVLAWQHPGWQRSALWSALAGALVGIGVWLRPNVVLLAPCLSLVVLVVAPRARRGFVHAAALSAAAVCIVLPITVRNYVVFREFVPVSINGGLTMWQGAADAGGDALGASRRDKLVMEEEAVRYGNPRYREWWAEPDGVFRDRERYRRSREVIRANPGRYARVALGRMGQMLNYASGVAPTVADQLLVRANDEGGEGPAGRRTHDVGRRPSDERYLRVGRWAAPLAEPVDLVQSGLVLVLLPLVVVGTLTLAWLDWRRLLLLLAVPLYYLSTECFFIYEWRVVAPMHYGLFAVAGAGAFAPWLLRRRGRLGIV